MNPLSYHRSLLQEEDAARSLRSPAASSFATTSPFDSSLVLTILILLTVLFLMAFFSLYIRRFSSHSDGPLSGRHNTPPRFLSEKRGGVNPATVRSLPNIAYGGGGSSILGECSICLSEFEERETVTVIPYCRHVFHPMCIERWLLSHVSCPLCRSTQLFPVAGDDLSGDGGGER